MPNYISRGQSALDLRESQQSPEITVNTPFSHDAFLGETLIGIALGSPRDSPLPPLPPEDSEKYVPQKPKLSRWKSFGGLFGRKGLIRSASTSPYYASQPPPYHEPTPSITFQGQNVEASSVTHCYASCTESPLESLRQMQSTSPKRTPTMGSKSLRRKMSFKRSNSQRKGIHGGSRPNKKRSYTAPLPRSQEDGSKLQVNGGPLLQVEIPNVEMERYSVMFSNLLQPPTTSCLLARRQAHLEELDTGTLANEATDVGIDDQNGLHMKESREDLERPKFERRTLSTSSTKSSTFSLFPATQNTSTCNSARKITLDRSPLSRSMTAPGAISQEQNQVIVIVHGPARASSTAPSRSSQRGNSYSDTSHRSQSSTDASFVEAPESPIEASRLPLKAEDLPLRKSSMRAPHKPDPAPLPSVPTNTPKSTPTKPNAPDQKPKDDAEISIARQISVSKRQRHLLVPIVPKTARQPMQPTVIDVREPSPCRKSHHVVVEGS